MSNLLNHIIGKAPCTSKTIRKRFFGAAALVLYFGMGMAGMSSLPGITGCTPSPVEMKLVRTQMRLALSDETLKSEIKSYVLATFFSDAGYDCTDLLEKHPDELYEIKKSQQPISVSQALCPHELDSNTACPEDGSPNSHLLADLYAPGQYSILLLGSRLPYADSKTYFQVDEETNEKLDPLKVLSENAPSVIAMGCREIDATINDRQNIELILFPAGLR